MDKSIYLAMHGAQHALKAQKVHTNNLANINVAGFKADVLFAQAVEQADNKVYPVSQNSKILAKAGGLMQTNDPRDITLSEENQWFVVNDGSQNSLTRNIQWQVSAQGELTDSSGRKILNQNGAAITANNFKSLEISNDGRVLIVPEGNNNQTVELGRLQVVSVQGAIAKRFDGSLVADSNATLTNVKQTNVVSGFQEGSNVSSMATMTEMMDLNRYFENQMSVMKDIKESASLATKLLDIG